MREQGSHLLYLSHREMSSKESIFGFILFLKRGHMGSLPEEMHPGALPHFAWIKKH